MKSQEFGVSGVSVERRDLPQAFFRVLAQITFYSNELTPRMTWELTAEAEKAGEPDGASQLEGCG